MAIDNPIKDLVKHGHKYGIKHLDAREWAAARANPDLAPDLPLSWGFGVAGNYHLIAPINGPSAVGETRMVGLLWCDTVCDACEGEGEVEAVGKTWLMAPVECPVCDGSGLPRPKLPELEGEPPPRRFIQTDLVGTVWAIDGVPIEDLHRMAPLEPPPLPTINLHSPANLDAFFQSPPHTPGQPDLWRERVTS